MTILHHDDDDNDDNNDIAFQLQGQDGTFT